MEGCREILNEVCTCGCRGTGKIKEQELREASLELLKKYVTELQQELELVHARVKKIEAE